jgi:hypothetical protein
MSSSSSNTSLSFPVPYLPFVLSFPLEVPALVARHALFDICHACSSYASSKPSKTKSQYYWSACIITSHTLLPNDVCPHNLARPPTPMTYQIQKKTPLTPHQTSNSNSCPLHDELCTPSNISHILLLLFHNPA